MAEGLPFADGRRPVVLVVLASEQLWPNLESICLYRESLRHLVILHTSDRHKSGQPAQALAAIAQKQFNIEAERMRVGPQPRDVTAAVAQVIRRFKEGPEGIVLNATCGTKLMTAGILRWVDAPGTATIYREFEGTWYRLRRDRDGRSITAAALRTEPNPTDVLDIRLLLKVAWSPVKAEVDAADLPDLPIDQIAATLAKHAREGRRAWIRAFRQVAPGHMKKRSRPSDAGGLFEAFVAGCVRQLGATNGILNVEFRRGHTSLQELDVVVNSGGRIVIVDCKIGRPSGDLRLLQEAAQIRQQVGGLSAGCVVLRPDKPCSQPLQWLSDFLRIRFVPRERIGRLCHILGECLGVRELPRVAIETDRYLAQWNAKRP